RDEINFLIQEGGRDGFRGARVELNAMTSDELIGFVENKFEKHGVKKVVPDDETLQLHARRMLERQMVLQELDNLLPGIRERVAETALPDDLRVQVEKWLEEHPRLPWDAAVADILDDMDEPDDGDEEE